MTPAVTTLAQYRVADGQMSRVLNLLADAARKTMGEQGNLYFHAYRSADDPDTIVLLEGWESDECLARHRRTPHFTDIVLGQILPLLRERSVTFLRPAYAGVHP